MGLGVIASKRGVFNFAHGEFLLLGANAIWRAQETGLPVWLGMVAPPSVVTLTSHADVVAHRRQAGRPMPQFDAQIAAIARSRGAVLATCNVWNFEGCGITVVNPWTDTGNG